MRGVKEGRGQVVKRLQAQGGPRNVLCVWPEGSVQGRDELWLKV